MAELIPVSYHLRIATNARIKLWVLILLIGVLFTLPLLVWEGMRERATANELTVLKNEFHGRRTLITRSQELREKRESLAERMEKIQQLMDDHILLGLLRDTSQGFGERDRLEYIHIDARGTTEGSHDHYAVSMRGMTENNRTLGELMQRLEQKSQPPWEVRMDSSRRVDFMDGNAVEFQVSCDSPQGKS